MEEDASRRDQESAGGGLLPMPECHFRACPGTGTGYFLLSLKFPPVGGWLGFLETKGAGNTQTPDIRFWKGMGIGNCIDRGIEISSKLEFLSSATLNSMACLLLFRV